MAQPVRRPPIFEVCVHGQAYSAQSDNRVALNAWKRQVSRAAVAAWGQAEPLVGAVELHIVHYGESRSGDLDNLNKPIQDAMQGVVFIDDRQVSSVRGSWRDIEGEYRARYIPAALGAAFSDGTPFVHIRAWHAITTKELD